MNNAQHHQKQRFSPGPVRVHVVFGTGPVGLAVIDELVDRDRLEVGS